MGSVYAFFFFLLDNGRGLSAQPDLCKYGFGCLQCLNPVLLLPCRICWPLYLLPDMCILKAVINTRRNSVKAKARLSHSRASAGWRLCKLPYIFARPPPRLRPGSGGNNRGPAGRAARGGPALPPLPGPAVPGAAPVCPFVPAPGAPRSSDLGGAGRSRRGLQAVRGGVKLAGRGARWWEKASLRTWKAPGGPPSEKGFARAAAPCWECLVLSWPSRYLAQHLFFHRKLQ